MHLTIEEILDYWFNSTKTLDLEILNRYQALWKKAYLGEYDHWMDNAKGSLALVIVLDQLPLNIFRG
ncbi:hypothetical protein [uncultured Gammaproteobacteria bacterium]|nr:hypothetical protein [uncultured Gammaproteobacteria bacterium]CAC9952868.1 hypothetical protein [uncultured Gammaproteobacteria bacterium]SHN90219.1 hypothetical protein BHECKSOX_402 [Bathymodiolus heckerae thiotrophic gill symbiont]